MADGFRVCWNIFPIFFSLVASVFTLIVVISGTTSKDALADVYFMRINTTAVKTVSLRPTHSIKGKTEAQTIGLYDFYQNSLWGYCEGDGSGSNVSFCSDPQAQFVFDPAKIFENELIQGVSITIPTSYEDNLDRAETATKWMFACYLVGSGLTILTLLCGCTTLYSRAGSVGSTITACLAFVFVGAATVIAQVMFGIYARVINDAKNELNVTATLGQTMFALSWIATVTTAFAFVGYLFGICCGEGGPRYRRVGPLGPRGIVGGDKPIDESYEASRGQYYV